MSTRSQLQFVLDGDDWTRVSQVYRHSDGYPEAVVPDLKELCDLQADTGTLRGPDYTAANFIFLGKLRAMRMYLPSDHRDGDRAFASSDASAILDPAEFSHLNQPAFLLGHGVESEVGHIHGDEEYLYVVRLPRHRPGEYENDRNWRLYISGHNSFPRWDGADDRDVFSDTAWEFEGTLDDALERYC